MLKPTKHTNPKLSILNIGGFVISELKENELLEYNELLHKLKGKISEEVAEEYQYALSFLFLLDKIEYITELDSLKLK